MKKNESERCHKIYSKRFRIYSRIYSKKMGYKEQQSLSTTMKGKNPTIKNIIKIAKILDYKVILISKDDKKDTIVLMDNSGEYDEQDTNN